MHVSHRDGAGCGKRTREGQTDADSEVQADAAERDVLGPLGLPADPAREDAVAAQAVDERAAGDAAAEDAAAQDDDGVSHDEDLEEARRIARRLGQERQQVGRRVQHVRLKRERQQQQQGYVEQESA